MNKGQVVKLCRRIKLRLSNVRVPENNKTLGGERQMNKSSFGNPLRMTMQRTDYMQGRQVFLWQPWPLRMTRGQATSRADKSSFGNPVGMTRRQTTWMTDKFFPGNPLGVCEEVVV